MMNIPNSTHSTDPRRRARRIERALLRKRWFGGLAGAVFALACAATPAIAQVRPLTSEAGKIPLQHDPETLKRGEEIAKDLGWDPKGYPGLNDAFWDQLKVDVFAGVYGRAGMSVRDRELVIMTALIAQGAIEGLQPHFSHAAPRLGITEQELRELIYTTCIYAAWPFCARADMLLTKILAENPPEWTPALRMKPAAASSKPEAAPSK